MNWIKSAPMWARLLILVFSLTAFVVVLLMYNNSEEAQRRYSPGTSGSEQPAPPSEPEETIAPSTPPAVEEVEEKKALALEDDEFYQFDPDESFDVSEKEYAKVEAFAIKGFENYYAETSNESMKDRKKRLGKFFLANSPFLSTGPLLGDQHNVRGGDRSASAATVDYAFPIKAKSDTVVVFILANIEVLIMPEGSPGQKITTKIEVQVVVKKVDEEWRITSIMENGDIAR